MRTIRRSIKPAQLYDHVTIERRLADMAAHGWQLDRMSAHIWQYRRIEPEQRRYALVFDPQGLEQTAVRDDGQPALRAAYLAAGWEEVCIHDRVGVFSARAEQPRPVENPAEKIQRITAAMRRGTIWRMQLGLILLTLVLAMFAYVMVRDPIGFMAFPANPFLPLACLTGLGYLAVCLRGYGKWRRASGRAAAAGDPLPAGGSRKAEYSLLVLALALGGLALVLAGDWRLRAFVLFYVLVFRAEDLFSAVKRSAPLRALLVVGYVCIGAVLLRLPEPSAFSAPRNDSALPLATEDFAGKPRDLQQYRRSERKSVLLHLTHAYREDLEQAAVYIKKNGEAGYRLPFEYILYETSLGFVLDVCEKAALNAEDSDAGYRPAEAESWQAERVYTRDGGEGPERDYIIRWADRVVFLRFADEPTPRQIAIAADRLRGG